MINFVATVSSIALSILAGSSVISQWWVALALALQWIAVVAYWLPLLESLQGFDAHALVRRMSMYLVYAAMVCGIAWGIARAASLAF